MITIGNPCERGGDGGHEISRWFWADTLSSDWMEVMREERDEQEEELTVWKLL